MRKPSTHAGPRLLAIGFLAGLFGWPQAAPALPLIHSLAVAGAQEDGEEDPDDLEEDVAVEDEAADIDEADVDEADVDEAEVDEAEVDEAEVDEADVDEADVAEEDAGTQDDLSEEDDDADAEVSEEEDADDELLEDDDYDDDSWAGAWSLDDEDETDDAIAVDDQLFGDDEVVWQIVEEDEDDSDADSVDPGQVTLLRTSKKAPGKPKPPRRPGDDDDTLYSYGGLPVSALSVPWQAQILYPGAPPKPNDTRPAWQRQHYCGGALIAPEWVVTAAHCINQQMVDLGFKVRLGVQDISKPGGTTYRIDRIVRHSQYNAESNDASRPPNMYANDIALIRIVPDAQSRAPAPGRISQIPVNLRPLAPGIPVSATGWGVTGSENADAINAVMLRVDLQMMPNPVCQQRPGYGPQKIREAVFCASNPRQSTCRGDSGGPVVLTNGSPTLVGIVSWGKRRCAGDGRPGVYTRIDQYAEWISQAMKLPAGRNSLP